MYVEHQLVKQATLIIKFVKIAICNTKITMVSVFTEHGTTSLNHPSCSNNTLSIYAGKISWCLLLCNKVWSNDNEVHILIYVTALQYIIHILYSQLL